MENWLFMTGDDLDVDLLYRDDTFSDFITKAIIDDMTVGRVAAEIRYSRSGDPVDLWYVDPTTIRKVLPGGFVGSKEDIDPSQYVIGDSTFWNQVEEERSKRHGERVVAEELRAIDILKETD